MKTIDVLTTSIPRLMTSRSIGQFLDAFEDRDDYRLRWLFHLDQFPYLEAAWDESLRDALTMIPRFDDALVMASRSNVGFGGSVPAS